MNWIDQLIIGIFDTYGTNDPYDILNQIDINIIKVEKSHPIILDKNCTYIAQFNSIYIRNDLIPNYELFYLRHELGHVLLHLDINNKFFASNSKIEREANYFAFKLSRITFDEIELYQMTLEQICCSLEIPYNAINKLVNL